MILRIMLTSECLNDCSYCFVKTSPNYCAKGIDKGLATQQILDLYSKKDIFLLEVIGGETFDRPDLIKWILEFNKNNGKKVMEFFTSGLRNYEEVYNMCLEYKNDFKIRFNISYDGSKSLRNQNNFLIVKDVVKLFKQNFDVNIRWSINKEDIPNIYYHFLELIGMGIKEPIFFPMKYFDYSEDDIKEFSIQFNKILDYCIEKNINIFGLLISGDIYKSAKSDFECEGEIALSCENKWINCYVSWSSCGFKKEHMYDNPEDVKGLNSFSAMEKCKNCLDFFGACNKCIGNLEQYRRLTGNQMWDSYCRLLNTLGKIYIDKKMKYVKDFTLFIQHKGFNHLVYSNKYGEMVKEIRSKYEPSY